MSNEMHPWLAQIYGTDGGDDIEKTAQMHLLNKLAEANDLDLSQFSPEELQQLAQQLLAEDPNALGDQGIEGQPGMDPAMGGQPGIPQQGMPGQRPHPAMAQAFAPAAQPQAPQGMPGQAMAPQGADPAAMQKEAQAKFEEADLLGRVMAHSYTNELEKIAADRAMKEKTAGKMQAAASAAKGAAGKAADHLKRNKKAYGAGAAGAAGGFAAGRMSKKASAFEKLAEMHAAEILGSAGFDPSTGQDMAQDQGQADPNQQQFQGQDPNQQAAGVEQPQVEQPSQFGEALDNRALEMLQEAGYDVNEILARLQLNQNPGQA